MSARSLHYRAELTPDRTTHIAPREKQILYMLACGIPRHEVADLLGVSTNTVHTCLSRLYERWAVFTLETALVRAIVGGVFEMADLKAADAVARRRWEGRDG